MSTDQDIWTGGCACGHIRYEASQRPADPGYCHCATCRKSAGAPVMAFADVALAAFRYTSGTPAVFRSSERGERRFCPLCGTQLDFRFSGADVVEVSIASLDRADELAPQSHHWHADRLPWFETADSLPRFAQDPDAS